jgi:hypothetical protein
MWYKRVETIESGRTCRVTMMRDGKPVAYGEAVERLRDDEGGFRARLIGALAEAPFAAYFWELPPVTRSRATRPFEFVFTESPVLVRIPADASSFEDHFRRVPAGARVAVFPSLGGDATLVVPCPRAPRTVYPHLAAFARNAPAAQQHAFWRRVGDEVATRLDDRPLWLSTSGLGVPWLHVRLDSRPKYYSFAPYRRPE